MLPAPAFSEYAALTVDVDRLLDRIGDGASADEIELRVTEAQKHLQSLGATIGAVLSAGPFESLSRHLRFVAYYHRRGEPQHYASDMVSLRQTDLPAVAALVEAWLSGVIDEGLADAVRASWAAGRFASVVRDAFIYLEDALRAAGEVDRRRGLSGDRLVTATLGPQGKHRIQRPAGSLLGDLTTGEEEGLYLFIKGAFLLFRNATAHRQVDYTAGEADDIVGLVNLCLRLVGPRAQTAGEAP